MSTDSVPAAVARHLESFNHLRDAIYIICPQSARILAANHEGCHQLGMTHEQVQQHTVFSLQRHVLDLEHWQHIVQAVRSAPSFTFNGHHVRSDGTDFPVEVVSHFVNWDGEDYLLSDVRDMTERLHNERELQSRDPLISFVLNEAMDGVWGWNVDSGEVYFSPQLKRMLGYGPYEMPPRLESWSANLHPEDRERVMQALDAHLSGKTERYEMEYRLANRNGSYLWVHDRGRHCQSGGDGRPQRVIGMVQNISARKHLEQQLRHQASHDELTQLMNRRAGYERLEHELLLANRHHHELSVALLDLDGFKLINDTWGHQAGDEVLRIAADVFRGRVRKSDSLVRWGGEEFLVVMPLTAFNDAAAVCEELRSQLELAPCFADGSRLSLTVSIGLADRRRYGETVNELVHRADQALYRAKSLGRNRVVG